LIGFGLAPTDDPREDVEGSTPPDDPQSSVVVADTSWSTPGALIATARLGG
jgi:hypothetical protein